MKPVIFHQLAGAELGKTIRYLERERAGWGYKFEAKVEAVVSLVRAEPKSGSEYKGRYRYFSLEPFSYVVYYEEYDNFTGILAIAHGSRRQDYWKRRKFKR